MAAARMWWGRISLAHAVSLTGMVFAVTACGASIRPMRPGTEPAPAPADDVVPPTPPTADSLYFATHGLMVPVIGVAPDQVPDTFDDPRDNGGRLHRATDIMAPRGTPVVAAAAGTILRMSQSALGGITIYEVDDDRRFLYYYAHLDHYSELVSAGGHVQRGDILGYVGSTGNADPRAPHLHFQAMRWDAHRRDYWNGTPVDVRPFFRMIGQEWDQ